MDCLDGLRNLPDNFVDLTVTSPPYDNLRTYNGYTFDFESIAKELYRVTKQGGVVVWVVGDATVKGSETGTSFKQALYFKEVGFNLHDTMIYAKSNPMPVKSNRYNPNFEYMFVFSKGKPLKVNLIVEPSKRNGDKNSSTHRTISGELKNAHSRGKSINENKVKNNVWVYAIGRGGTTSDIGAFQHPAIFPEKLANDHIISWSNENDVVLDPFMGSGTTAKMALLNRRNFIGFEISKEYCDIANERIEKHRAE